jgi:hypothetical protein
VNLTKNVVVSLVKASNVAALTYISEAYECMQNTVVYTITLCTSSALTCSLRYLKLLT